MIEPGQLRRWTHDRRRHGKLFLVLEHEPFMIGPDLMDDGWFIMESGDEHRWEITEHIEESSVPVQA